MEREVYRQMYELEDRHWWFRGRRAVIRALAERALGGGPRGGAVRVLDAGCGTGRNVADYAALGPATGADPSREAVEFCRERGLERVVQAGVEALPFDDASFDLVLATDVLEHVDDDAAALRELRRVAAPGGALVATVPAYRWLWSAQDVALHHRRRYARRELVERARAAGWEPHVATHFNTLLLPAVVAGRALRRGRPGELEATPGWLDAPLSLPMRAEAKLIARGGRLPAGVSIGVAARSV
jgi:SAM-dependent methyltransferase